MFLAMKTGRYALVPHRTAAPTYSPTRSVKIFETYWTRSKLVKTRVPVPGAPGQFLTNIERRPLPPAKTYTPNGKREVARRLRQMEARAHV
jgi:hypothetical protein